MSGQGRGRGQGWGWGAAAGTKVGAGGRGQGAGVGAGARCPECGSLLLGVGCWSSQLALSGLRSHFQAVANLEEGIAVNTTLQSLRLNSNGICKC